MYMYRFQRSFPKTRGNKSHKNSFVFRPIFERRGRPIFFPRGTFFEGPKFMYMFFRTTSIWTLKCIYIQGGGTHLGPPPLRHEGCFGARRKAAGAWRGALFRAQCGRKSIFNVYIYMCLFLNIGLPRGFPTCLLLN